MCFTYLKFRTCPIDLKEAVASVIFASMRCSDVTELADVRKHFKSKYGKEFEAAALEVRPDSGVNRLVIQSAFISLTFMKEFACFLWLQKECILPRFVLTVHTIMLDTDN